MIEEVVLYLDDDELGSISEATIPFCRICHEGEFESCKILESPCSCSGTLKYAHRDCVQRWCNEKGDTVCEICLQKFEGGFHTYTAAPSKKTQLIDSSFTIRVSVEISRIEEVESPTAAQERENYSHCSSVVDRSASFCRSVALILTVMMLMRHILELVMGGTGDDYPFTLPTLIILRASGILLPMYLLIRLISAVQNGIRRQ